MSDSEIEIDYADPPQEDSPYEEPIEREIQFADSFNAQERVSGFDDEGWRDMTLFQSHSEFPHIHLSPEERFRADVQKILIFKELELDKHDKQLIVGRIQTLNWITFKVPLLYILGYYVASKNFSRRSISYALQHLEKDKEEKFELIKYARYWKSIIYL